jgi:hypothetical protein
MLETVREANKIINNFWGERDVFYKNHIGAMILTYCGSTVV